MVPDTNYKVIFRAEGGDISCGMRATDGVIEACRIDDEFVAADFLSHTDGSLFKTHE